MKIECPQCGQHYDVDSSMLDRHFRCTECKTFFLGLNAKTVKEVKYKRVEHAADDSTGATEENNAAPADSPVGKTDESEVKLPAADPENENRDNKSLDKKIAAAFPEEEMPTYSRTAFKAGSLERIGIVAALLMCVFLIILLLVCNSRLNDVSERLRAMRSENTSLQGKLEQQERLIARQDKRVGAVEEKFIFVDRWSGEVDKKLQNDSLQKQLTVQGETLRKLESRLAEQTAVSKELEKQVSSLVEARRQAVANNKKNSSSDDEDDISAVERSSGNSGSQYVPRRR